MICIKTDGRRYCEITGHAGFAEVGHDIVCAAVSALFCTLVIAVDGDSKESVLHGQIRAAPTQNNKALFRAFTMGCREIAAQYPDNVQLMEI